MRHHSSGNKQGRYFVTREHASSQQLMKVFVDSGGEHMHSANYVDEVLQHCEVCPASGKAPRVPIAGASAVSMICEKLQADLSFSGELIAPRAMGVCSKYPP